VLNAFKDFKDMFYHVSTRLFLSWILTLHMLGFSWSSNVGCIHNLKSQGKCFPKIACDIHVLVYYFNFCIFHVQIISCVLNLNIFLTTP
jgi:hypothetical protein